MEHRTIFRDKIRESVYSVLPITIIVAVVCFSVVPVTPDLMLAFLIGAALLILGMGFFTIGADMAMTPIGSLIGAKLTKTRKLGLILLLSFVLGVAITVAEPDLQVLAATVPHVDTTVLVLTVAVGVGIFLTICMLRILLGVPLRWLLLGFYAVVFIFAVFTDMGYLSIAFDAGGVTTGPMTVPFIMALGVGVASIRSDKNAEADSFGLVALCSVGPVIAVMALGFLYQSSGTSIVSGTLTGYASTVELGLSYLKAVPHYMGEMAAALSPIVAFFLLFQVFALKLSRRQFLSILIGIVYTYAGLVLFLTGVNVGFSALGAMLGSLMAEGWLRWLLVPLAMLMGCFIISAEPAVHVLNKQVEEVSSGAISARAMGLSLSLAVAVANGLAFVRVVSGIPILWFLIPGYVIALVLSFVVPPIFTAIAFDSGGVASGPMTATFMLPLAMGASEALGGNVVTDAFGLVAMVAMMPLITVQVMGAVYVLKTRRTAEAAITEVYDDLDIIELWEIA